jgi:hypothetical protein
MQRWRRGRVIVAAIIILTGVAVVGSAATNRLPKLTRAWGTLASSVASSLAPSSSRSAPSGDGGGASGDAGGMPHRQTGPLSSAQLGAPLVHGAFVSACGAPDNMKVVVDVGVKFGRAVSVIVKTRPPNRSVAACVERATRELQWDVSPKTDHVTVTY